MEVGVIMKIILAKTAGFCFGVDRALKKVYDNVGDKEIYTYGPIIHNKCVVDDLENQGVKVISDLKKIASLSQGEVVIRSHGISKKEHQAIEASGLGMIEATCPYVKHIHKKVEEASNKGHHIIIIGNKQHPEVKGISGWSSQPVTLVETVSQVEKATFDFKITYEVVAQTTFNISLYKEIIKALQKLNIHVIINETICSATQERQEEALKIASIVDFMIVIGDKNSSNTMKLYEICKKQCDRTYHIESIKGLALELLEGQEIIGITAGASTPKKLIEEVISNVRNAK